MKRNVISNVVCIATAFSTVLAFAPVALAQDGANQNESTVATQTDQAGESAGITASDIKLSVKKGYTFKVGGCTYKVLKVTKKSDINLGAVNPGDKVSVDCSIKGTAVLVKYSGGAKAKVSNSVSCKEADVAKKTTLNADGTEVTTRVTVAEKGSFDVVAIGEGAFNNAKGHKVTSAVIGKNIATIDDKAFYGCKKLTKITLKGDALRTVGPNSDKKLNRNNKNYVKNLYQLRKKKWKVCKAFKGTPRSCTIKLPNINATKGLSYNMQYANAVRLLAGNAGFVGMVL